MFYYDKEKWKVKIADLIPGMLLKPVAGYAWVETPWRGTTGKVIGHYLCVVSERATLGKDQISRNDPVLYLGTADSTSTHHTPGKQVVLAWGKKLTISSNSWRHISN